MECVEHEPLSAGTYATTVVAFAGLFRRPMRIHACFSAPRAARPACWHPRGRVLRQQAARPALTVATD